MKSRVNYKSARHKARICLIQVLYHYQITRENSTRFVSNHIESINNGSLDKKYFHDILAQIIPNIDKIDQIFLPYLDRPSDDLSFIELTVLRLAVFEIYFRSDIPHKVVINEAIELNKTFGSRDGFKYINGVLDKIVKKLLIYSKTGS